MFQVSDSLVRDGFRVVQIEHLHVLQRGQVLQALVRDFRIGQVDALQLRQARQLRQVGVRHPGVAQIDADRFSGGIVGATGAECRDLRGGTVLGRSDRRRQGHAEPHEPPAHHAANHGHSSLSEISLRTSRAVDQLRRRLGSLDFGSKMISHWGTASRTCR